MYECINRNFRFELPLRPKAYPSCSVVSTASRAVKDYWDLSGLVADCQLFLQVGYRVANDPRLPEWKPGTEFKAKREASLRQAGPAN